MMEKPVLRVHSFPLFNADDYKDFVNDPNLMEQVALTKLMGDNGVDLNVYGHDHIFTANEMETQRHANLFLFDVAKRFEHLFHIFSDLYFFFAAQYISREFI